MDIFLLYLFTRLDPIGAVVSSAAIILMIVVFASFMFYVLTSDDGYEKEIHDKAALILKRAVIPFLVSLALAVLLPSQKDAALILAGYGVVEVAKSDTANRLASKSVQLIEQTLDEYLHPKKSEK